MHFLLIQPIHIVNAASHGKRTISDNIQSCIAGLNAADAQLLVVKSAVNITITHIETIMLIFF